MLLKILKASASRHVLLAIAACTVLSGTARAQMFETPAFTPAGQWTVGSTELSSVRGLSAMKLPCVISNEFDNGFVVRLSGGGGQFLAMAIDFRQDVFVQGRKYDTMISIGGAYAKQVSASAFTTSTLIFNLRPVADFYEAVKNGEQMEIAIDDNKLKFSLAGVSKVYQGLESCYSGGKAAPIKPMMNAAKSSNADMPAVAVAGVEETAPSIALPEEVVNKQLPNSFDDIVQNADTGTEAKKTMNISQVTPKNPAQNRVSSGIAARESRVSKASLWNARAGEDIKTVLARWSSMAGYDLEWQAQQGGRVAQDVALNGDFEDAVSQLLAENTAATGIAGHIESDKGRKDISDAMPLNIQGPATNSGWNAVAGADIQSILNQWGASAGVAIVWKSNANFLVKQTLTQSGSFETAVQSLLDQYTDDSARPVGQLNVDPQTGQRTLVMDVDKSRS